MDEITKESLVIFNVTNPPVGIIIIIIIIIRLSYDYYVYISLLISTVIPIVCPFEEILVLGCGKRISRHLDSELTEHLKRHGIIVEYQNSVRDAPLLDHIYAILLLL